MANIKWLLLFAGVLILVAGAGLSIIGDAPLRAFDVLTVKLIDDTPSSPPAAFGQLAVVAGFAGLLGVGWMAACGGISGAASGRSVTVVGRLLYLAAGLVTFASTVPMILGAVLMRQQFLVIATSESAPSVEQLTKSIASTSGFVPVGFYGVVAAGALVVFSGCVGFQGTGRSLGSPRPQLTSYLVTGMTAAFAVLFCLFFLFVSRHGGALSNLLFTAGSTPRPAELATHLMGILSKSFAAYVCLALLGGTQVLAALLAPSGRGDL